MESGGKCKVYKTLPQLSHTCWFNGILHVLFYSSGLRKTIYNHIKNMDDFIDKISDDSFFGFMYYMLHNYKKLEKIHNVYEQLYQGTINTDYILITFLRKYDIPTLNYFKKKIRKDFYDYKHTLFYIYKIFMTYGINYIDLIYDRNTTNVYIQSINRAYYQMKELESDNYFINKIRNSDILCITHNIEINTTPQAFAIPESENLNRFHLNFENYSSFVKNIHEFSKKLVIAGNEYILDSCIIANYNNPGHIISGISCEGVGNYVYDSWDDFKSVKGKGYKENVVRASCPAYKHDWTNANKVFAISGQGCNFGSAELGRPLLPGFMGYNIATSQVLLIYIKSNPIKEDAIMDVESYSLGLGNLQIDKKKYLEQLREIYDLESLSTPELVGHIMNIYNEAYRDAGTLLIHLSTSSMAANCRFLYERLLKKPMNPDPRVNDDMRRELYIVLILKFIKNGTIFRFDKFMTSSIFQSIKQQFISIWNRPMDEQIDISFNAIGLSSSHKYQERTFIITNIHKIYTYLFETVPPITRWYNTDIHNLISEIASNRDSFIFLSVLIRYYIDIEIYKYKIDDMLKDTYQFIQTYMTGGKKTNKYIK